MKNFTSLDIYGAEYSQQENVDYFCELLCSFSKE